jgi:Invasion associated locus B (IalB) protein
MRAAIGCHVVFWRRPGYRIDMRRYAATRMILSFLLLILFPTSGSAANSKKHGGVTPGAATAPSERIGAAGSWTAYTYTEKSVKVCYIAGEPQKSEPAGARRRRPVGMVTHRLGENAANVVNFVEGYPLKQGSEVSLHVGGEKFDLFTKGDGAWARTSELDKTIVEALAKGKQVIVKGTPPKGPGTSDTYSLAGFAQALAMIDKACEIKR